ncbi:Protein BUD31 -like protein [Sarcoptes scabiei]|uniref:Protein BUD31 homolog n=1 Tax=Sarcoptes scabiei TaxID=52283 RepID=A0A834R7S0_SARSC|nr:Protein BUD31 -like protein [Sarcoptes scabiei]
MPRIRNVRNRNHQPPDGWDLIEPTIEELEAKMREAESESHEGKRRNESLWPIFKIHHQKSRFVYDLFYKRKTISRELYDYCIQNRIADAALIAKWKKQAIINISILFLGYENLCCLRCIQVRDTNFGTNCICRVPREKLDEGRNIIECIHCGCRGCSG